MIIGIDANEANTKIRVGVNQYAFELFWSIYKLEKKAKEGRSYVLFLKNKPLSDLPPEKSWWKYQILSGGKVWILTKLTPYLFFHRKMDMFFSPNHYLPPVFRIPMIFTIHDLGYLEFSEQFTRYDYWQLRIWTAISIFISKYIITVSKSSRNDIVRHYKFASNKTKVIYHGLDHKRFTDKVPIEDVRRIKKLYKIRKDYILYLGTLKPSKNILGILRAYKVVRDFNYRATLVIAGKKGWMYSKIYKKTESLGISKHVLFTDYVKEFDKPSLMAGARVFVSPSFWEGFGMHLLESMAVGTPVVASRVGSIPEVCGSVATYVDPDNISEISSGIIKYLKMTKSEYNSESRKVVEQANKFTWQKTAYDTVKLFKEIKRD